MPFKQVLGDVENALGKMHDWAGMGYDVNTYDEFFFFFFTRRGKRQVIATGAMALVRRRPANPKKLFLS